MCCIFPFIQFKILSSCEILVSSFPCIFKLQIFGKFLDLFWYWFPVKYPSWSRKAILCDYIKFVMVCLMVQNMVYLGACSMYTWKECVFLLLLDGVLYKCQLDQESTCSINYLERNMTVSEFNCGFVYLSFQCYQF